MLVMFKLKNYTSFRNETILDMRATTYKQHLSHVLNSENEMNLLKVNAIYGPNASGKSNFILGMYTFRKFILSQFLFHGENGEDEPEQFERHIYWEPFRLGKELDEPIEFEIIFLKNGKQFQYGFESTKKEIIEEWLYVDDQKVFERKFAQIQLGTKFQQLLKPYKKVPEHRLYISVMDYFLNEEEKKLFFIDFVDFFKYDFHISSEFFFESSVKGQAGLIRISRRLVEDEDFKKQVESYLKRVDVGIKRLEIEETVQPDPETGEKNRHIELYTIHDVFDDNGNAIEERKFTLRQESSGTLRFMTYIQNAIRMIEEGGVFIVDELSARLHPLMTKMIVDIFDSDENEKAQLIFTTHDLTLLNRDQFRRDEIIMVDKDQYGQSLMYALSDLKVREDATFVKDYLQGKYGAIPIIRENSDE